MATADDDLIAGRTYGPVGYGKWTLTALRNLDNGGADGGDLLATTKRLGTCDHKPIRAKIQAETQAIRWTDDPDVDPTAATGMLITVGTTLEYDGDLSMFRMIAAVAGAIAHVTFYSI